MSGFGPLGFLPLGVSSATAAIAGTLAATEANDTLSSAGALPIVGTLAATEAGDTVSSAGALPIVGTLASTEAADTLSAAGALPIVGTLAATEANDSLSATGALAIAATAAISEAADTVNATGALVLSGAEAGTEEDDTLTATGVLSDARLHGRVIRDRKPNRPRGRRLIFPEELAPVEPDAPVPIAAKTAAPIPWRQIVATERAETERLRLAVERAEQTIANAIEAQALEDLRNEYAAALELLREAQAAEMAWIMRLRDEDDFLLLAA